jgi:hypothetical protein
MAYALTVLTDGIFAQQRRRKVAKAFYEEGLV